MSNPIALVLLLGGVLGTLVAPLYPHAGVVHSELSPTRRSAASSQSLSTPALTNTLATWLTSAVVQAAPAVVQAAPAVSQATSADAATLYVDAVSGDDDDDGLTPASAFRTLQHAADVATPGTVIRVLPGIYRESVRPSADGTAAAPITFVADQGPGTAVVRGSYPSSALTWTQLPDNTIGLPSGVDPTNLYVADLSGWGLPEEGPRFVVALDGSGEVTDRLPLAREPDWEVVTDWRYHEYWWTADGGWKVAECDPTAPGNDWNCDLPSRCDTRLTDRNAFAEPDPAIEAGDLTQLGDLTGAEMVALDAKWGHYLYRRRIESHDVVAGTITTTGNCLQDGGGSDPGLGWGSKYYVEGHPALLDTPGEWWYDRTTSRLYLWPPSPGNPADQDLEISRHDIGVNLEGRSYITLDGLTVELVNDTVVKQANYWALKSHGNILRNLTLRYGNHGVFVQQSVQADQPADNVTRDFVLENSEIAHIDTHGLFMSPWWDGAPNADTYPRSGMYNTTIRGNELHHLGFGADEDNAIGVEIQFPDRLIFEDNHVHDIAHNGVQFLWSVIDSTKTYGFTPDEIKIGDILVKDNLFEETCQLTTDCGALKFWGQPPNNHVFRDVLVTGNIFRDVAAWTYVAQQRVGWWQGGEQCEVKGQAGFGFYLDYAAGIHLYRNLAYNNSYAGVMLAGTWRDGDLVFANNTIANSLYGFRLSGVEADTHGGNVNTQIINNLIVNNEGYGIYQCTADDNFGTLGIDHNLYYNNGWRAYDDGGVWRPGNMAIRNPSGQTYYPTLADIRAHPYGWEAHGVAGDPYCAQYDVNDHDPYDGSRPDFSLTGQSAPLLDAGAALPSSLTTLLQHHNVADGVAGDAPDLGWKEAQPTAVDGFFMDAMPAHRTIRPGGSAEFVLDLQVAAFGTTDITLSATTPDPRFDLTLSPNRVNTDTEVSLVLNDTAESGGGGAYTIPVVATDGTITRTATVTVFVATTHVYLPRVSR